MTTIATEVAAGLVFSPIHRPVSTTVSDAALVWDIYARQSADDADGIERQIEDCTRAILSRGGTVGQVYIDNDESADSRKKTRKDYRPEFRRLMNDVAEGRCQAFCGQDQDRLMRDVREGEDLIDLVEKTGVRVAFARSGEVDLATVDGRMHVRLKAVIAKQETEKKGERQRRAAQGAAEGGKLPTVRSFGYAQDGTIIEAERDVIRQAVDIILAGGSLRSAFRVFEASGLATTRNARAWLISSVRAILINPRLAGVRCYKGKPVARGSWEPIVTDEEHLRLVALLTQPDRRTNHNIGNARKHLGGGLYLCGVCLAGGRITRLEIAHRSSKYSRGKGYNCRPYNHVARKADAIDYLVTRAVERWLATDDAPSLVAASSPALKPLQDQERALEDRLTVARQRLDRGVLDEDEYVATKRDINSELTALRAKKTKLARSSALARITEAEDPVKAFQDADLNAKREVIDALMDVVVEKPPVRGNRQFHEESIVLRWREGYGTGSD